MNTPFDPLGDDESSSVEPQSRESIKSFWICCAGLSVAAHALSIGCILFGELNYLSIASLSGTPNGRSLWDAEFGLHIVLSVSLIPSIVLGSVVPILYWRGSLVQRFAISIVLAITAMNIATSSYFSYWGKIPWRSFICIMMCWIAMPTLFLLTPIHTRFLRLIVASCLLLLTLCLSIVQMIQAPGNLNVLYWGALYGTSFGYALLRRNWGRVALLEADSNVEQIERTSTRTLLELMAVCGLACAVGMYWSIDIRRWSQLLNLVQASLLGIVSVLISMTGYRIVLGWRKKTARATRTNVFNFAARLVCVWIIIWGMFCANSVLYFVYNNDLRSNWNALWGANGLPFGVIVVGSFCASLLYTGFLIVMGMWLRVCGWRTHDQ